MELTVYVYSKHRTLRKCSEVYINTHFYKHFEKIRFKELSIGNHENSENNKMEDTNANISDILKCSFESLRKMHESLKLKESHDVWLLYIDSFVFDSNKNCSIILLNSLVQNFKAKCHLFKGDLSCINKKDYDLEKSKILNENLKKLFNKDPNLIRY